MIIQISNPAHNIQTFRAHNDKSILAMEGCVCLRGYDEAGTFMNIILDLKDIRQINDMHAIIA